MAEADVERAHPGQRRKEKRDRQYGECGGSPRPRRRPRRGAGRRHQGHRPGRQEVDEGVHRENLKLEGVPDAGGHEGRAGQARQAIERARRIAGGGDSPGRAGQGESAGVGARGQRQRGRAPGQRHPGERPPPGPAEHGQGHQRPCQRRRPGRVGDVEGREFTGVGRHEGQPEQRRQRSDPGAGQASRDDEERGGRRGVDHRHDPAHGERGFPEPAHRRAAEREVARSVAGVKVQIRPGAVEHARELEEQGAFVLELEAVAPQQPQPGQGEDEQSNGRRGRRRRCLRGLHVGQAGHLGTAAMQSRILRHRIPDVNATPPFAVLTRSRAKNSSP